MDYERVRLMLIMGLAFTSGAGFLPNIAARRASASENRQDNPKTPLPAFGKAEAMPEMDKLFRQTDGWIGADGAHSFSVTPQRTIWLFSDTWVGKIRDGKRADAT